VKFNVKATDIDGNSAPAVQIDFPSVFFRHLDRMSKTSSEINEEGKPSVMYFQLDMLEALIFPWTGESNETEKIILQKVPRRPGISGSDLMAESNKRVLEYCTSKMKALLVQALNAGILPGFKPPEKKIGLKVMSE
jgi:hypothetical protein